MWLSVPPANTAYGSAVTLDWIVSEKQITPHIPVFDKSRRNDGSLSREDFAFDTGRNLYVCPQGKLLHTTGRVHDRGRFSIVPGPPIVALARSRHDAARRRPSAKSRAASTRALAMSPCAGGTEAFDQSRRDRKRVEMLLAHLKRTSS